MRRHKLAILLQAEALGNRMEAPHPLSNHIGIDCRQG